MPNSRTVQITQRKRPTWLAICAAALGFDPDEDSSPDSDPGLDMEGKFITTLRPLD
jgi:hypothetical protein